MKLNNHLMALYHVIMLILLGVRPGLIQNRLPGRLGGSGHGVHFFL